MANEENIPQSQPEPDEKLVQVFGTPQESEALVVQSLLSSAGIESMMTATDSPQDVLAGVGGFVVRVREEQAKEAEGILADYQAGGAAAAEQGEIEFESTNPDQPPL